MITVYLVQHGMALSKDIDDKRPLSDSGIADVRKVANALKEHGIVIEKIFHSGKLRAVQTATVFAEILNVKGLAELQGMQPNDDPNKLIEQMTDDAIMYIGHLPNIQNVLAALVTGDNNCDSNSNIVKFQNSAVACIENHKDDNHIKWFITAELCS